MSSPNSPRPSPRQNDPTTPAEPELTIDVLAQRTGVTTRTIRFYRQSGLLPPPVRVGLRAVYGAEQVERLQAISSLREQGLSLEAIGRALGQTSDDDSALVRLNRIGERARLLWDRDKAGEMTVPEILQIVGPTASPERGAKLLARLESYDVVRSTGKTRRRAIGDGVELDEALYEIPSLGTLDIAGRLFAAGVSPELAYESWTAMRQWLRPLATDLVNLFSRHTRAGLAEGLDDEEITAAMREVLPIALRAVQLVFTSEIEHALDELVSADETPSWLQPGGPR